MIILTLIFLFQSTLSVRRATGGMAGVPVTDAISIHALREESDAGNQRRTNPQYISIHALREESDPSAGTNIYGNHLFQSTLSVRRATVAGRTTATVRVISIHALREESDSSPCQC